MPIFGTTDEIDAYILGVTTNEVVEAVIDFGKPILNQTVNHEVYRYAGNHVNDHYEHTFGLMDSAETQVSTYGKANVSKRVHFWLKPKGKYPSEYGGSTDNSDKIVDWMNNGHKGFYYKDIDFKGLNFFEIAAQKLIKGSFLKNAVQNRLKFLGYVISRTPSQDGDE